MKFTSFNTCKYEMDPVKNSRAKSETPFSHVNGNSLIKYAVTGS